jgi:hypothetical protein
MQCVLCVINFSSVSLSAVRIAIDLAMRYNARLSILYTYRLLPETYPVTEYRKKLIQQVKVKFSELEQKLHLNGSLDYDLRTEVGFVSDRVEAFLQHCTVSMLVIDEHVAFDANEWGTAGLHEFMHRTGIPVLIVPERVETGNGAYNFTGGGV